MVMEELTEEPAELAERVAALDIGKGSLVCWVRVPHESRPRARRQEVRTYGTVTPALLELRGADWEWRFAVSCGQMRSGAVIAAVRSTSDVLERHQTAVLLAACSCSGRRGRGSNPATPAIKLQVAALFRD
jgi:hypothetical protein